MKKIIIVVVAIVVLAVAGLAILDSIGPDVRHITVETTTSIMGSDKSETSVSECYIVDGEKMTTAEYMNWKAENPLWSWR